MNDQRDARIQENRIMSWWLQLDKPAGSRPRCVSMMHGERSAVADRLTRLVDLPDVVVTQESRWMPRGLPVQRSDGSWDVSPATEAKLDEPNELIAANESKALSTWWLAHSEKANTPNWDIASTCKVSGKNGLLLVEAKAHSGELAGEGRGKKLDPDASDNSFANHLKIGNAISDAAARYQRSTGLPFAISRDQRYQMSNRFAMASKLAEMGYAVVLVYLGFLNAREMAGRDLLTSLEQWEKLVTDHSVVLFPKALWGQRMTLNGHPFIPIIRTSKWSFEAGADG
jgi:hypothetical protein